MHLFREPLMKKGIVILVLSLLCIGILCTNAAGQGPSASAALGADHALYVKFQDFAASRIVILNRSYLHRPDNVHIEAGNPHFTGRYSSVDPATVSIEVKMTGSRLTPYIGVLHYIESTYESKGPCRMTASRGPFYTVSQRKVTEIFRYAQNQWQ